MFRRLAVPNALRTRSLAALMVCGVCMGAVPATASAGDRTAGGSPKTTTTTTTTDDPSFKGTGRKNG